nr:MAG TPA: hypothetical protein [Caudoviricetes sp.]
MQLLTPKYPHTAVKSRIMPHNTECLLLGYN